VWPVWVRFRWNWFNLKIGRELDEINLIKISRIRYPS
jgi:hypothetical protein